MSHFAQYDAAARPQGRPCGQRARVRSRKDAPVYVPAGLRQRLDEQGSAEGALDPEAACGQVLPAGRLDLPMLQERSRICCTRWTVL